MDIIERLRFDAARCEATYSKGVATNIEEAADAIERLTAENERLRAALEEICKVQNTYRSREQELAAMCLNQQSTLQES